MRFSLWHFPIKYHNIEAAFRKVLGNNAKRFLESHLEMKLKDLTSTSCVDVMGCFQVI